MPVVFFFDNFLKLFSLFLIFGLFLYRQFKLVLLLFLLSKFFGNIRLFFDFKLQILVKSGIFFLNEKIVFLFDLILFISQVSHFLWQSFLLSFLLLFILKFIKLGVLVLISSNSFFDNCNIFCSISSSLSFCSLFSVSFFNKISSSTISFEGVLLRKYDWKEGPNKFLFLSGIVTDLFTLIISFI